MVVVVVVVVVMPGFGDEEEEERRRSRRADITPRTNTTHVSLLKPLCTLHGVAGVIWTNQGTVSS